MNEIKLYKSKWKAVRLMLICLPFILGGLWLINNQHTVIGWLSIGFFSLGIIVSSINLFDKRPQIIINEIGIIININYLDKDFTIKWGSIKDIYIKTYKNSYRGFSYRGFLTPQSKFLYIILDESSKIQLKNYRKKNKSAKSSKLGINNNSIPLTNLESINDEKFLTFVKTMNCEDESKRRDLLTSKLF